MSTQPDQLLRDGVRSFEAGQWSASEAAFLQLLDFPAFAGEASYGIGMARMGAGDWTTAERYLRHALEQDPRHADAAYHLGGVTERLRSTAEARTFYERALAINPRYEPARARLAQIDGTVRPAPAPAPPPPAQPPASPDGALDQHGVLEFLLRDGSDLSRQGASLIQALRTTRHACFSVHLGRVVQGTLVAAALTGLVATMYPDPAVLKAIWAVWLGVLAIAFARVKATRYVLANGRLQVARGLLARRIDTYDLWLVHDLTLRRTLGNRLTRDGSLILHYSRSASGRPARLVVAGLARGRELDDIYQRLQNLKFVLRANNAVKGIVQ